LSNEKYRVHEVAKDFKTTSKVITQILTDYATTAYVDGLVGDINSVLESIING
jgi:hypothetical protein